MTLCQVPMVRLPSVTGTLSLLPSSIDSRWECALIGSCARHASSPPGGINAGGGEFRTTGREFRTTGGEFKRALISSCARYASSPPGGITAGGGEFRTTGRDFRTTGGKLKRALIGSCAHYASSPPGEITAGGGEFRTSGGEFKRALIGSCARNASSPPGGITAGKGEFRTTGREFRTTGGEFKRTLIGACAPPRPREVGRGVRIDREVGRDACASIVRLGSPHSDPPSGFEGPPIQGSPIQGPPIQGPPIQGPPIQGHPGNVTSLRAVTFPGNGSWVGIPPRRTAGGPHLLLGGRFTALAVTAVSLRRSGTVLLTPRDRGGKNYYVI
eukprot:1195839-Prorocentrum_minimum.AAC.8